MRYRRPAPGAGEHDPARRRPGRCAVHPALPARRDPDRRPGAGAGAGPACKGPGVIDLVLVADHAGVREGLRSVLDREPDVRVVGEAASPQEAMRVVADVGSAALVLLDLKLSSAPGLEGLELCAQLTQTYPGLAVLVLTTVLEDSLVVAALRNGARGYVVKEVDTSELLRAIRAVHRGENAFDPRSSSAMVRGLTATAARDQKMLTAREIEVLGLLARGLSNREIG